MELSKSNKRKRKAFYRKCAASSSRRPRTDTEPNCPNAIPRNLQSGMSGYLVTFNAQAAQMEAFRMLNQTLAEYTDPDDGCQNDANHGVNNDLAKIGKDGSNNKGDHDDDDDDDIYAQLHKENCSNSELDPDSQPRRFPFYALKTYVNNNLFIVHCTTKISASQLGHRLYQRLLESNKPESRYVLRLMPVLCTCHSDLGEIKTCTQRIWSEFLNKHRHNPIELSSTTTIISDETGPGPKTYMVMFKARNFDCLARQEVIDAVMSAIKSIDSSWTGDLVNPAVVVCINVLRKITCLSVLENYAKYCKYNIAELVGPPNPIKVDQSKLTHETNDQG